MWWSEGRYHHRPGLLFLPFAPGIVTSRKPSNGSSHSFKNKVIKKARLVGREKWSASRMEALQQQEKKASGSAMLIACWPLQTLLVLLPMLAPAS